jgi:hypothetical protein
MASAGSTYTCTSTGLTFRVNKRRTPMAAFQTLRGLATVCTATRSERDGGCLYFDDDVYLDERLDVRGPCV